MSMIEWLVSEMKEFMDWETVDVELLIKRIKHDAFKYDYDIAEEEVLEVLKRLGR